MYIPRAPVICPFILYRKREDVSMLQQHTGTPAICSPAHIACKYTYSQKVDTTALFRPAHTYTYTCALFSGQPSHYTRNMLLRAAWCTCEDVDDVHVCGARTTECVCVLERESAREQESECVCVCFECICVFRVLFFTLCVYVCGTVCDQTTRRALSLHMRMYLQRPRGVREGRRLTNQRHLGVAPCRLELYQHGRDYCSALEQTCSM